MGSYISRKLPYFTRSDVAQHRRKTQPEVAPDVKATVSIRPDNPDVSAIYLMPFPFSQPLLSETEPQDLNHVLVEHISMGEVIGRGGFATVYACRYKDEDVAVKKFHENVFDQKACDELLAEISMTRKLNDPNVVNFIGYVYNPALYRCWILMEFVPGGSMRRFCPSQSSQSTMVTSRGACYKPGPRPTEPIALTSLEKLSISFECCKGLEYLHHKEICHKDIKPENILVSNNLKIVKICDLGSSKFVTCTSLIETHYIGTVLYYPPEVALSGRNIEKSDVYSLALTLAELIGGQSPWNVKECEQIGYLITHKIINKLQDVHEKYVKDQSIVYPNCFQTLAEDI